MEVVFDNNSNVLRAKIRARHDSSVIYTVNTEQSLWRGRLATYLKDKNPLVGGSQSVVVGVINWKKKVFEIVGVRQKLEDLRRKVGEFGKKCVDCLVFGLEGSTTDTGRPQYGNGHTGTKSTKSSIEKKVGWYVGGLLACSQD